MESKLKLFGEYFRVHSNEAYEYTVRAAEHLASSTLLILGRKSDEERRDILTKAHSLTDRLSDVAGTETPIVAALAFLTAIRTLERVLRQQADQKRNAR